MLQALNGTHNTAMSNKQNIVWKIFNRILKLSPCT